jgi:hypothetical protein
LAENSLELNRYPELSTYEDTTGCCDLALCSLVRIFMGTNLRQRLVIEGLDHTLRLGPQQTPYGSIYLNQRFTKKCLVWLSEMVDNESLSRFSKLLEKIYDYYDVIVLPRSLYPRSKYFGDHFKFTRTLVESISILTNLPSLADLISIPNPDESIFISDIPCAGWMFSSIGVNSIYLSKDGEGIKDALMNGYCQVVQMPLADRINLFDTLKALETGQLHRRTQLEISKIYCRIIAYEILGLHQTSCL